MMLGHNEILKQIEKNHIYIDPFSVEQLGPNSYDVRMGNWIVSEHQSDGIVHLDTHSFENWKDLWQEPKFYDYDAMFVFAPGAYILTHTQEVIGSHKYATLLKARSTIARCGIDICASAGFGDVGFVNHWTLEIRNNSKNNIVLKPGMRLGQIAFLEVKGATQYEGAYKQRYSTEWYDTKIVQDSILEWKPEDMLPKLGESRVF